MEGPKTDAGVNTRALELLFKQVQERSDSYTYEMKISCVEIYK
jgi:hypothetical protein